MLSKATLVEETRSGVKTATELTLGELLIKVSGKCLVAPRGYLASLIKFLRLKLRLLFAAIRVGDHHLFGLKLLPLCHASLVRALCE